MSEIKTAVIGVGGAGCAVLDHIIQSGCGENIVFIAVDTDMKSLDRSSAHYKITLSTKSIWGRKMSSTLGTVRHAAKCSRGDIAGCLVDTKMAFIITGMGYVTGTRAAPVIAKNIRKTGVLTIGIAYLPFLCEGQSSEETAQLGLDNFKESVDSLFVVENEHLVDLADETLPFSDAYKMTDEVSRQAVLGLTSLLNQRGFIERRFEELQDALRGAGTLMMSLGVGEGEERAKIAVRDAIAPIPFEGTKHIIAVMTTGSGVRLQEVMYVADSIKKEMPSSVQLLFGHVIDDEDTNLNVKVTLFVTYQSYPAQIPLREAKVDIHFPNINRKTVLSRTNPVRFSNFSPDEELPYQSFNSFIKTRNIELIRTVHEKALDNGILDIEFIS